MKKNILYIGRFQPFHKGHADAVSQILEDIIENLENNNIYNIFIGIGSAENNFTESNPLTAGERFEIIEEACHEILANKNIQNDIKSKIKFHIVPIRNIDHYALWPNHVQQYLPEIDILYSGSPLILQLWEKSFSYKLNEITKKITKKIEKRIDISGTQIRKIISNNDNLQKYLLNSTILLLEKFELQKRLQNMKTY
jgi:nicotinamide-nucleotide adenylyltransferase